MCNNAPFLGTEELGHFEMIATLVHQLTRNMSMEERKASGFDAYYVDHTACLWPQAVSCGHVKWYTSSALVKRSALFRITWIPRTSMLLTLPSIPMELPAVVNRTAFLFLPASIGNS